MALKTVRLSLSFLEGFKDIIQGARGKDATNTCHIFGLSPSSVV